MKRLLYIYPMLILLMASWQQTGKACDLQEAYEIASIEATRWDASAKPYFITSVDDPMESETVKGGDGKRRYWNFDFVAENTNKHCIVTVHDKTVVNVINAESAVNCDYVIDMEEFHVSTAEAVTIAKERYGLLPGADWAEGYHFVLENDGSALLLSVVGRDQDGKISRIFFNVKTGQVLS